MAGHYTPTYTAKNTTPPKPAVADNKVEGNGDDKKNPSEVGGQTGNALTNADSTPKLPEGYGSQVDAYLQVPEGSTTYGTNPSTGQANTSQINKDASATKNAQDNKKKQGLDQSHPTAASQAPNQPIHEATMAADPNATAAIFLKKAMQSMVMLRMMDKLTSPAGILSMASGGLGGALQGLAGGVGLGSMMGALNGVMPNLAVSGLLTTSATNALHTGMMGMLNNVSVGALAASEVAAAASTVSTISGAMSAISSGNIGGAIDAVAQFGGASFGLQPGSLAAKIALIGPSGYVNTTSVIKGITINTVVQTSPIPHPTQNIPILAGAEHVAIATAAVSSITGDLSNVLGIQSNIGQTLGSISNVTAGVSNLAGAFSNISSFTHTSLAGVVNGGIAGVVDGGLSKILGFPMSGLLSNVTSLIPQIGGSITSSLSNLSSAGATVGNLITGLTNATKALSLSKAAHNVAQNIFGQARAEQVVDAINATANLAAAVGGPISHITAFGDRITSSPVNAIKSAVNAGTQVVVGNGTRLV